MPADQIRAVVVTTPGEVDVLRVESRDRPEPGPGQLAVDVIAAGVNFADVYRRQGIYPTPTPFVLGSECAGTVTALGEGVAGFAVGDVVASAEAKHGSHAGATILEAETTVPVPAGVTPELAAAVLLQGLTAHYLVNSTYSVQPGDQVLMHAGAGGVGQLLIQLAKAKGAHVVATVGRADKVEIARAAGADEVLRYDELADLAAAVRAASNGGVHVVYDGVGRTTFDASLAALRRRGTLAVFGAASGQVPPFDVQRLNSGGSLFVTRPTLAHYVATRDELLWRSGEILAAVADGSLRVAIGGRYPLEDVAEAYNALEGRRTTGKVLLIP